MARRKQFSRTKLYDKTLVCFSGREETYHGTQEKNWDAEQYDTNDKINLFVMYNAAYPEHFGKWFPFCILFLGCFRILSVLFTHRGLIFLFLKRMIWVQAADCQCRKYTLNHVKRKLHDCNMTMWNIFQNAKVNEKNQKRVVFLIFFINFANRIVNNCDKSEQSWCWTKVWADILPLFFHEMWVEETGKQHYGYRKSGRWKNI